MSELYVNEHNKHNLLSNNTPSTAHQNNQLEQVDKIIGQLYRGITVLPDCLLHLCSPESPPAAEARSDCLLLAKASAPTESQKSSPDCAITYNSRMQGFGKTQSSMRLSVDTEFVQFAGWSSEFQSNPPSASISDDMIKENK
jgi:hypothetical protein